MTHTISPEQDLFSILNAVELPARYTGGEYGSIRKTVSEAPFRVAVSFPDLYEIGMSNTAVKLLYGMLNAMAGVACERVFVPAPDFERELAAAGVPLYTLETGTPVHNTHLLAISYGYELLATNVLTLLSASHVPVLRTDRSESDPVVLLGGPGATNPLPMSPFVDGVFCGEAEAALPELVMQMSERRDAGGTRSSFLDVLEASPHVWTPSGRHTATRAIWTSFGRGQPPAHVPRVPGVPASFGAGFPVPHLPIVQDHGPIEIMRGCPQGCRFCHAGVFYRPYRMKPISEILVELEWLITHQGYRDITLSSLSSGDYTDLTALLDRVNGTYRSKGINVQLPSLRVNSLTLPIFEQLSQGKRSGLTFAVEAAHSDDQRAINKLVPIERTIEIAREALTRGWKHAKLYFMIGLPVEDPEREAPAIVEYVRELRRAVKMEFVVNVGTFVPKPHTPFQWDQQLSPMLAQEKLSEIRAGLPKGTRLRAHDPWMSWLEGILTRGNEKTGLAIARAHELGARLDAWGEHVRRDVWESVLQEIPDGAQGVGVFSREQPLPWSGIDLGVTASTLRQERHRTEQSIITEPCRGDCVEPCGVCNRNVGVHDLPVANHSSSDDPSEAGDETGSPRIPVVSQSANRYYLVIQYRKDGPAAFIPHLGLVRTFERVWNRLGLPLALTEGYHPKARMSFGQPLPLGVDSDDEIVVLAVQKNVQFDTFSQHALAVLPKGIEFCNAVTMCHVPQSPKIPAPMQRYGGSIYTAQEIAQEPGQAARGGDVARGHACVSDVLRATPGARVIESSEGVVRFHLDSGAPGLGRIIKDNALRGRTRFRRTHLLGQDGESLFGYYAAHAYRITADEGAILG